MCWQCASAAPLPLGQFTVRAHHRKMMPGRFLFALSGALVGAAVRMLTLPGDAGASSCPHELLPLDLVSLDVPEDEVQFWTISFDADEPYFGLGEPGWMLPGALVARTGESWALEQETE